jgi:anti-sigma factor ChrR (cupin superfamily)
MTVLIPTCERVTELLTAYEEGALGPFEWLGLTLHLLLCPPCQTFLDTFERIPNLLRQVLNDDRGPAAGRAPAEQALAATLAALREGRVPQGPQHHPEPEAWAALGPAGDPLLSLLLRVHLGHCADCRATHGPEAAIPPVADPLEALRPHLPPDTQWRWIRHGLGGAQAAILHEDATTGASLNLVCLPGGRTSPRHNHAGRECALVLCGGLQDGPAHLRAGDWIAHSPGHLHGPTADPGEACWALIALQRPVQFTGWRGVLDQVSGRSRASVQN